MLHLSIRLFPEPILRQMAAPVDCFDDSLRKTVEGLDKMMRSQPSGIGIAAPQVGISKRIAIVDVSARMPGAERLVLINPEILEMSDERPSREGCMSIPDYTGTVKRYDRIHVRWQDEYGKWREKVSRGIEAVCIQHEVDHLKAILFIDRVTSLKRDMVPRRPVHSKNPKKR